MKTHPSHIFDFTIRFIIKAIWEPFSLKRSHWWHWLRKGDNPACVTAVRGYKKAKERKGFWSILWQTNFAWNMAVILEPVYHTGQYQLGFMEKDKAGKFCSVTCSIVLQGQTAVLRGPSETWFYGFSYPDHKPIPLMVVSEKSKWELNGITLI